MQILHIDSSILGGFSVSRELTKAAVAELVAKNPGAKVEVLDLAVAAPSYQNRRKASAFRLGI